VSSHTPSKRNLQASPPVPESGHPLTTDIAKATSLRVKTSYTDSSSSNAPLHGSSFESAIGYLASSASKACFETTSRNKFHDYNPCSTSVTLAQHSRCDSTTDDTTNSSTNVVESAIQSRSSEPNGYMPSSTSNSVLLSMARYFHIGYCASTTSNNILPIHASIVSCTAFQVKLNATPCLTSVPLEIRHIIYNMLTSYAPCITISHSCPSNFQVVRIG